MISDKILIYNNLEELHTKCFACHRFDHIVDRCPLLHFVPQREFLILRHLFNKPTLERLPFSRKSVKSANSRGKISKNQQKLKEFLSSLNMDQESVNEFSESDSSEDDENFDSAAVNSGVVTSMTKINQNHKKSMISEGMPSQNLIRNPVKELSSVVELDKDEDDNTNTFSKERSFEKKATTEPTDIENPNNLAHNSANNPKRTLTRTAIEREQTYKHEKSMDREMSRKFSVFPDSMVDGRTAFSREREKTTKIQSGVYNPTSMINNVDNKNDLFFKEFDKMTIFDEYFPHNNSDKVIKNLHYRKFARRASKYSKLNKSQKNSRKTRKSTKNLAKDLSNLGLAIRLPSLKNDCKELNGFSPSKSLRPKKSFFTDDESSIIKK